ncbi:MAG: aminotransferase class I/II-fold pyridoxal phosphate-dependent enzyme [Bacteroidota bacterium]
MRIHRRSWIKQFGMGIAGIGLSPISLQAAERLQETKNAFIQTGDPNQPIILRSNENPYGPSPLARKAFSDNLTQSNRYHWEIASALISDLADRQNVKYENILLGAGSTEILDLVSKFAAARPGGYVIADPSYGYWTSTLDHLGMKKIKVPLDIGKSIDLKAMAAAIDTTTRLVYICNPNNPTGTLLKKEALVDFVTSVPATTTVVVDEAYLEYTVEHSLADLVSNHANLVIVKTFSKIYGLAGARIGYAIAHQEMIQQLSGLQSNTNNSTSLLSKVAAIASLKDHQFVFDCQTLNEKARSYTAIELQKLNCRCIPSHTNFMYFSLANYQKDFFQLLKDNDIQGTAIYEEQGKWTRITIGTLKEMQQFIGALK